ncbi:endonuclease-reverse transcriptase [Plakobranchus ocellatus]|uniref:Endonuclease-reverse transcriptase n=1 Tax=Plakobranchus ocellatus TaxID=259542 RepID=A0AAV4BP55_9GAST|nr:endonuclease-reverse transcriptase [Plakobranchus ocellatus]
MERILDENQPRDQAGFRKGYSTTDHIYTLNQVIEKSNEYNLPLCVGFIDYEKAFYSVEHFAIFDALRKININETYVTILENIYRNASARVHIDNLESEPFPIHRGVRQGDPISPKLFTAAIEMISRKADLEHGLNVDGETLTNLRFADDNGFCEYRWSGSSFGKAAGYQVRGQGFESQSGPSQFFIAPCVHPALNG